MIITPTTIKEIDKLIKDEIQEDLHLDYKDSRALDKNKRHEIAKDVSSFANSDGGILIYGITEKDNLPVSKDTGVDNKLFSRETLEQIISSNITPRIDGIRIIPIQLTKKASIYVVEVPKSSRAPHQSADKKYYKRFNFQSVPMEDYEINDVRNRQLNVLPLINIDVEPKSNFLVYFRISNVGSLPAYNVTFSLQEKILWMENRKIPSLFIKGTKFFPPNKTYYFLWNTFPVLFHQSDEDYRKVDISVKYLHPHNNEYVTDSFHIDIENYRDSSKISSDVEELKNVVKDYFTKLISEIKRLNSHIEEITKISGKTGLDLSVTTLRNLKNIIANEKLEKISPKYLSYETFMEILGIDTELADKLEFHFRYSEENNKLDTIQGITPEFIEKFKEYFILDEN